MKYFLLTLLFTTNLLAADMLKIAGGVGFRMQTTYDDTAANIDVEYMKDYDTNFTYGLSGGTFRIKDFYYKENGVDLYKIKGYDALYVCGRAGVSIRPAGFMYADLVTGPCYFTDHGILIGGNIQFNTTISYGLRDPNTGSQIGLSYKHFSNAGLSKPNYGVNLVLITMGIAL